MRERKRRWDEFTHEDHEHEGLAEADLKEHEELTKAPTHTHTCAASLAEALHLEERQELTKAARHTPQDELSKADPRR